MSDRLRSEIKQKKKFGSLQEELVLSMLRTVDQLTLPLNEVLREAGLSSSQYNVLRILRGAGDEALPCGEIGQRMVQRDPDLTRLLDRLESRGLVSRSRGTSDRRVVEATITKEGLRLLEELQTPVELSLATALSHVPQKDQRLLLSLLEKVRKTDGG